LTNTISVQTYSPYRNQFRTEPANQFTLAHHNPFPNTGMGAIAGRVRNTTDCAAVPGITVRAGTVSTTTAADGSYRLSVVPGNYSITASGTGWNANTKADRVTDSLETQMNFYLSASTPPPPCTLNPASPSVTICTPANNAVLSSPVRVVAAARDSVAVSLMQIYVDGKAVLTKSGGSLDAGVPMATGVRRLTVQAQDVAGITFKQTIFVTVRSASTGCTAGPASPSVTICAPANNAVVSAPVRVVAASRDAVAVSFMQIYVDGKVALTKGGGSLDATVPMAAGVRRLTVQAKDVAGVIFKQTINIRVR
jgi:Carboxypeptidase regulatory-like domain/Bacterial Ig domain